MRTGRNIAFAGAACLVMMSALAGIHLSPAIAGWGIQAKSAGWVQDASKATLPTTKISGTLSGSPFTVKRAVWRQQSKLDFSDAPLDIMVLEISGQSKKPHDFAMPTDIDTSQLPPDVRAEFAKKAKANSPNALTFVVTISKRKGASIENKEFLRHPKAAIGVPEQATPEKPILIGLEAKANDTDSLTIGYTLRLKFGPKRGTVQPGTIYLCLEDGKKSYLAGTFEAVIK